MSQNFPNFDEFGGEHNLIKVILDTNKVFEVVLVLICLNHIAYNKKVW